MAKLQLRPVLEPKTKGQSALMDALRTSDITMCDGVFGTGKTFLAIGHATREVLDKQSRRNRIVICRPAIEAGEELGFLPGPQPLDAKILTPSGWTTMGQIKPGDLVIGRDGLPTEVLGIFPKGKKAVYRLTTTENTTTECCEDHLWFTRTREDRKRSRSGGVKTTRQIMETLESKGKINHFLPRNEPVHFEECGPLPIPPYALGALLGDGCMSKEDHAVSLYTEDQEIAQRVSQEMLSMNCLLVPTKRTTAFDIKGNLYSRKTARKVIVTNPSGESTQYASVGIACRELNIKRETLSGRCKKTRTIDGIKYEFLPLESRWSHPLKAELDNFGILGKKAWDKFIPQKYKIASIADRLSLLQGLMDTDGTVNKRSGEAAFCTTSPMLAQDVAEIVRSLGGRTKIRSRSRVGKTSYYEGRKITSRRISYEMTISLPSGMNPFHLSRKSSLYRGVNFTHAAGIKSIELIGEKDVQCISVSNKEHLYITDDYIVTHNTAEEKVSPYTRRMYEVFREFCRSTEEYEEAIKTKVIEVIPLAHLQGHSLKNCYMILDEAQNATRSQIEMFLTRMDKNTRIIMVGSRVQCFLPQGPEGWNFVFDKLKTGGFRRGKVSCVQLGIADIVRHDLIAEVMMRLMETEELPKTEEEEVFDEDPLNYWDVFVKGTLEG